MPELEIAFRLDAGAIYGVSMGHAYRCVALKKALEKQIKVIPRAIGQIDNSATNFFKEHGITAYQYDEKDTEEADQHFDNDPAKIKVTDISDLRLRKHIGIPFKQNSLRVVFDDYGDYKGKAEIIVNAIIPSTLYKSSILLSGLKYAILNPSEIPHRPPKHLAKPSDKPYVVMTFGGSDPSNLTFDAVSAFGTQPHINLTVCVGPAYPNLKLLSNRIKNLNSRIKLKQAVPDLQQEFVNADIVVSAGGLTALEVAACGVPSILIPSRSSEEKLTKLLSDIGCSWMLPRSELQQLGKAIDKLFADKTLRLNMETKGPSIVDFNGATRVANAITAELNIKTQWAELK